MSLLAAAIGTKWQTLLVPGLHFLQPYPWLPGVVAQVEFEIAAEFVDVVVAVEGVAVAEIAAAVVVALAAVEVVVAPAVVAVTADVVKIRNLSPALLQYLLLSYRQLNTTNMN